METYIFKRWRKPLDLFHLLLSNTKLFLKPKHLFVLSAFVLISSNSFSANKLYNINTENSFSGGTSYCQDQTASNLSVTFNTCNYSTGAATAGTVTVTWYSNTTNSTSGGTQVSQTTGASTGTGATVTYTYAPSTTTAGTLYYYVIISAATNTGCGVTTTLTTASTQTVTVTECFKTSVAGGGSWNTAGTWEENAIPQSYDRVTIVNGATVTIDAAAYCYNLTVGQGTSGILQFEATTARTLTVSNNVTIASGGTFQSAATGTQTGHSLSITGSLTNNGTLDFSTNSNTAAAGITFTGSSNATFSGTGGTTDIKSITINKGTSSTPVLTLSTSNFTVQGVTTDVAGFLTLTNGTFKISGSFTVTNRVFTTAAYTIGATTGFYLNNTNFTVAAQTTATTALYGIITIDAGTYNVGTATDNDLAYYAGSSFIMNGGSLNVAGRFTPGLSGYVTFTQTAGTITTCTVGLTAAGPSFWLNSSSTCTMSGGYVVLRLANTGASKYDYDNSAGTRTITGGTVQLGDASSGAAKTYIITGYFSNLLVTNTSGNHTARTYNLGAALNVLLTTTLQNNTTIDANTNTSAITFTGDFTIGTSATFTAGSGTHYVKANFANNGTLSQSVGKITFNGASAQTISGSGTTTFHDLEIANTSGNVALSVNATVNGTLTMTSGDLVIATTKTLTIDDTDDPGISGGSATTHIVTSGTATVQKTYTSTTSITFPLGDGTKYRPLTLTPAGVGNTIWTVSYTPSGHSDIDIEPATGLDHISRNEYWTCNRSGGSPENATMALTWFADGTVTDYTKLSIAHYDGTTDWDKIASSPVGTNSSGTVTSNAAVSTFSPFTIASITAANPLPVNLISFDAKAIDNKVQLEWVTSSEINNDFFTIERTRNGKDFEFVANIKGAGNSNQILNYKCFDNKPYSGTSFYRLKQTDYDGKFEYFNLVSVSFEPALPEFDFIVYPNPLFKNALLNIKLKDSKNNEILVVVVDLLGKEYFSKVIVLEDKEEVIVIDPYENLPAGIYIVTGSINNSLYSKKLVVK